MLNKSLKIIQSKFTFAYSLDALLLADFVKVSKAEVHIIDLCSGNGIIPLFLSQKTSAHITGIEIQPELSDMAERSIAINKLEQRLTIINADLKGIWKQLGSEKYTTVTCNPPYFKEACSKASLNTHLAIARHEIACTIDDVIDNCSRLLRQGASYSSFIALND